MIIAPQTTEAALSAFANTLKETIQNHSFEMIEGITSSIGVTAYHAHDSSETLVTRADEALYESKNRGRNRVTCK